MALPSLVSRVSELEAQVDGLLSWRLRMPSEVRWARALNELRFVRAMLSWEEFLEQSFLCYLRGAQSLAGRTVALSVPAATSLAVAEKLAIGTAPYGQWLNEKWLLKLASKCFSNPTHPYLTLAVPHFREMRVVRNRIVHRSDHSRTEFQAVARGIYGLLPPGLTPGRLLSDTSPTGTRVDDYLTTIRTAARLIAA